MPSYKNGIIRRDQQRLTAVKQKTLENLPSLRKYFVGRGDEKRLIHRL